MANITIPLTTAAWNSMTQAQQQKYLSDNGSFSAAETARQNGQEITWTLSDSKGGAEGSEPKKEGGGGAYTAGSTVGAGGAYVYGDDIKDAVLGSGGQKPPAGMTTNPDIKAPKVIEAKPTGSEASSAAAATSSGYAAAEASAIAIPAGEMVPAGYTGVATLADGSTKAVSTSSMQALSGSELSMLGNAAIIGGGVLGAIGLANTAKNWGEGDRSAKGVGMGAAQGAASGAGVGAAAGTYVFPVIGTAAGAGIGAIAGGLFGAASKYVKAGKHKDQKQRDALRAFMQKEGLLDEGNNITFADGKKYDMGIDGGPRAEYGTDPETGRVLRPYELPLTPDELQHQSVGWALPLATLIAGGDKKGTEDLTGYLAKGAMKTGDGTLEGSRKNIMAVFEKMGLTPEQGMEQLDQLSAQGAIDANRAASLKNGLGTLTSGKYFTDELERFKAAQSAPAAAGAAPQTATAPVNDKVYVSGRDGPAVPDMGSVDARTSKPISLAPPRSSTSSPGIGKDGKPLSLTDEENKKRQNQALLAA